MASLLYFFLIFLISLLWSLTFYYADFKPDMGDNGLSVGAIVGIVAACCVAIILILVILWMIGCFGGKDREDKGEITNQ